MALKTVSELVAETSRMEILALPLLYPNYASSARRFATSSAPPLLNHERLERCPSRFRDFVNRHSLGVGHGCDVVHGGTE